MSVSVEGTLFYANWCGHCIKFKPEWDKLKQKVHEMGGKFGENKITINEYEDSKVPKDIAKIEGKDIRGYPTVKITVTLNGKKTEYEYEGKRNMNDLLNHLTKDTIKNIKKN